MVPEELSAQSAAHPAAEPALQITGGAGSVLREEDGIVVWRGFDPATVGTEISLARARAEAGTRIPAHWHSQDTVAYLMEGRAVFRTGEGLREVRVMEAGEWLFVPAGLVHEEESPDDVHFDFLYARDSGGGTTTFLDD